MSTTFSKALQFICLDEVHGQQTRKINNSPFVTHPIAVASIVLEHSGDFELAAAALMHDVLEDTSVTVGQMQEAFGQQITGWVLECTEPGTDDSEFKAPWKERKMAYLAQLATSSDEARLIMLADKVHNATDTLHTLMRQGPAMWSHFNSDYESQVWWYRNLQEELTKTPSDLQLQLDWTINQLLER